MKRNFQYDLLRFIAMLFVLAIHIELLTRNVNPNNQIAPIISKLVISITMSCNYIFFMLSGRFVLNKHFDHKNDYLRFYLNRIATLVIPLFIISYIALYFTHDFKFASLSRFLELFLSNKIVAVYWFAYNTIGLMVLVPFLTKMLKNMSINDKKMLVKLAFFFETILFIQQLFVPYGFYTITNFPLLGYLFYLILGNIAESVFSNKQKKFFIYAMPLCIIIKVILELCMGSQYAFAKLDSPFMLVESLGLYFLILEVIKIKAKKVCKWISFTAKHSYSFYLIHPIVILFVSKLFNFNIRYALSIIYAGICFILVFIITLVFAFVFDTLIFDPIKKRIINWSNRKFKSEEVKIMSNLIKKD